MSEFAGVGCHQYFPGIALGVKAAGVSDGGSRETWSTGIRGRAAMGAPTCPRCSKADLMTGNPPCSRYSSQSVSAFSRDQQEDLDLFPELKDVLAAARDFECWAVHWETGPIAWSRGEWMILSAADWLRTEAWGNDPVTTVTVRYDPRWAGIPQRRPRTHVIHVRGLRDLDFVPQINSPELPQWPPDPPVCAYDWVHERIVEQTGSDDPGILIPHRKLTKGPTTENMRAMEVIRSEERVSKFIAQIPRAVSVDRLWLPALNQRRLAWLEEDRWFGLHEWAALMTYPILEAAVPVAKLGLGPAMALMAKCVAPSAAEHVARQITLPLMRAPVVKKDRSLPHGVMLRCDMTVGLSDRPRFVAEVLDPQLRVPTKRHR